MKTPISYYGGKQNLLKEILPLIPSHIQYVEPFVGGGAVFFAKRPSMNEVINDLNGDITNFYMTMKTDFDGLQKMIEGTLHSEVSYIKAKEILKSEAGTKIERAWALWVSTNMSFGHIIFGGFAFALTNKCALSTFNKRESFTYRYMERISKVEIFARDALALIKLKDSEDTFFYLDPPYVSSDQGHYKGYTDDDFVNLLECLTTLKGKFLLSSYPEDILFKYIQQQSWNNKQIKQLILVDGKREEPKYKTECLTYNYIAEKSLFDD